MLPLPQLALVSPRLAWQGMRPVIRKTAIHVRAAEYLCVRAGVQPVW